MTRCAMILAAGRGARLQPLTDLLPKPLVEVAGQPLIVHQLERLRAVGVRRVVINLHHLGESIAARLGHGAHWNLDIRYVHEPVLLETAGGIIGALPLLGEDPFLVVNGDVYTDFDLHALAPLGEAQAHLLMVPRPLWQERGDFDLVESGRGSSRLGAGGPGSLTYAGIGRYHPSLFAGLAPGHRPLRPLLEAAIAAGTLTGQVHEGLWEDVGTLDRLTELRQRVGA